MESITYADWSWRRRLFSLKRQICQIAFVFSQRLIGLLSMKGELREIDRAIFDRVVKRNSRKDIVDRLGFWGWVERDKWRRG
jgi:hypothetical protein